MRFVDFDLVRAEAFEKIRPASEAGVIDPATR
jgi:hypothetical protein